ncbi:MAG: hypothetical protein VYE68_07230 [Acidobacteriota bacterium]|nr:hypothetical protein [Acidobacteriota bacterium]
MLEFCLLGVLADGASCGYEIITTLNTLGPLAAVPPPSTRYVAG